jgi:hypothetical protein
MKRNMKMLPAAGIHGKKSRRGPPTKSDMAHERVMEALDLLHGDPSKLFEIVSGVFEDMRVYLEDAGDVEAAETALISRDGAWDTAVRLNPSRYKP